MKKVLRSRILEHFEPSLINELYKVCKSSVESDNNVKATIMINILKKYNKDFVELGPGTNRLAILIDNYVFKLALDKWGLQDNLNEFTMSHELQPYVIKTYETNKLIAVSEYVTVISAEEFEERKEDIRKILGILAEGYLLGDVGTVKKNFCNWGYRDSGDLVALDYAYIYRVRGDEILCSNCGQILEYDENFYNLKCPKCGRKYSFMDIRRKIPMEVEDKENFMALELAYKLSKSVQEINDDVTTNEEDETSSSHKILTYKKEASAMSKKDKEYKERDYFGEPDVEEVVDENSYYDALNFLSSTPEHTEVQENNEHQQELSEQGKEIIKQTGAIKVEVEETVTKVTVVGNGNPCVPEVVEGNYTDFSDYKSEYEIEPVNKKNLIDLIPNDESNFTDYKDKEIESVNTECEEEVHINEPIEFEMGSENQGSESCEQIIPVKTEEVQKPQVNSSLRVFVTGEDGDCSSEEITEVKGDPNAVNDLSIDDLRKDLGITAEELENDENNNDEYEEEYEEIDNMKMNYNARRRGKNNGLRD